MGVPRWKVRDEALNLKAMDDRLAKHLEICRSEDPLNKDMQNRVEVPRILDMVRLGKILTAQVDTTIKEGTAKPLLPPFEIEMTLALLQEV